MKPALKHGASYACAERRPGASMSARRRLTDVPFYPQSLCSLAHTRITQAYEGGRRSLYFSHSGDRAQEVCLCRALSPLLLARPWGFR